MQYRPEIDGLRALAVVPVLFFHAGWRAFGGGFVGVDVFFVISGYLITSILMKELDAGRFSIARFYERRARRILPALFFVMLGTLPLFWLYAYPSDFQSIIGSVAATCLFVSNLFFWRESDFYFDAAAEEKPLLHMWSLAVEEQYYIVFPLMLMVVWRLGRRSTLGMFVGAFIGSFALSIYASHTSFEANFFLLPTRAWEILAGSLCAWWMRERPGAGNGALGLLGIVLIAASMVVLDKTYRFPSEFAIPPVLGTALIILFARPDNAAGRLLSLRVFIGIGLVSYSLYLWHQPLFVLLRYATIGEPSVPAFVGAMALSGVLAYASWAFVEEPFRRKGEGRIGSQTSVLVVSGAALAVVAAASGALYLNPDLKRGSLVELTSALIDPRAERAESWRGVKGPENKGFSDDTRPKLLLVGDSHGKDLFNVLHPTADRLGIQVRWAPLQVSCVRRMTGSVGECLRGAAAKYESATHVVASLRWSEKGTDFTEALARAVASDGKGFGVATNTPEFEPAAPLVMRSVAASSGISKSAADTALTAASKHEIDAFNEEFVELLAALELPVLSRRELACRESCDALTPDGHAVYSDYGHLTLMGAAFLGERAIEVDWLAPIGLRVGG